MGLTSVGSIVWGRRFHQGYSSERSCRSYLCRKHCLGEKVPSGLQLREKLSVLPLWEALFGGEGSIRVTARREVVGLTSVGSIVWGRRFHQGYSSERSCGSTSVGSIVWGRMFHQGYSSERSCGSYLCRKHCLGEKVPSGLQLREKLWVLPL